MQGSISEEAIKVETKLNFEVVLIVFNLKYLSQNFIKLGMLLGFKFDQDFTQKEGKNRHCKVKVAYYMMIILSKNRSLFSGLVLVVCSSKR